MALLHCRTGPGTNTNVTNLVRADCRPRVAPGHAMARCPPGHVSRVTCIHDTCWGLLVDTASVSISINITHTNELCTLALAFLFEDDLLIYDCHLFPFIYEFKEKENKYICSDLIQIQQQ